MAMRAAHYLERARFYIVFYKNSANITFIIGATPVYRLYHYIILYQNLVYLWLRRSYQNKYGLSNNSIENTSHRFNRR